MIFERTLIHVYIYMIYVKFYLFICIYIYTRNFEAYSVYFWMVVYSKPGQSDGRSHPLLRRASGSRWQKDCCLDGTE